VVIVAVYTVLGVREEVGVKVTAKATPFTVPATGVVPCIKVNVVEVIVKGSIASVKNAPTFVLIDTLVAPFALIVLVTMGGVTSGAEPVVQLQT
jgi:hypothetical protein